MSVVCLRHCWTYKCTLGTEFVCMQGTYPQDSTERTSEIQERIRMMSEKDMRGEEKDANKVITRELQQEKQAS